MPSPHILRELRVRTGTAFNTTFTNANVAATWSVTNSTKLRTTTIDLSDLLYDGKADDTLQTRMYAKPPMVPTIRKGAFKFSTYLEGANAAITVNPVATLLSTVLGGAITSPPTARSITLTVREYE